MNRNVLAFAGAAILLGLVLAAIWSINQASNASPSAGPRGPQAGGPAPSANQVDDALRRVLGPGVSSQSAPAGVAAAIRDIMVREGAKAEDFTVERSSSRVLCFIDRSLGSYCAVDNCPVGTIPGQKWQFRTSKNYWSYRVSSDGQTVVFVNNQSADQGPAWNSPCPRS